MSVGLDTSVVVRLLVGVPQDQCASAWKLVQEEYDRGVPVLVADVVVAEVFFALVHHYAVPAPEAVTAIKQLIQDSRFSGESATMLLADGGKGVSSVDFVDALIHQHYADVHRTFVTLDKKASRLPGSLLLRA